MLCRIFPLFARSVPQTTLRGLPGKDFDTHFTHEGIPSEMQISHLSSHGKQTTQPSMIPRKDKEEKSASMCLEKSFENGVKLRPECLAYDKRPVNMEEHGPQLAY